MARIRQIKPEFFRHGALQDLEAAHPGKYPMFVYAGLWTVCDKAGRFVWDPRQIKLDVLPFLPFDMGDTLSLLEGAGYIRRYLVDGKMFGYVPTFSTHQRISGKELQGAPRCPEPTPETEAEATGPHTGSTGEAPEKHPGAQGHVATLSHSHVAGEASTSSSVPRYIGDVTAKTDDELRQLQAALSKDPSRSKQLSVVEIEIRERAKARKPLPDGLDQQRRDAYKAMDHAGGGR